MFYSHYLILFYSLQITYHEKSQNRLVLLFPLESHHKPFQQLKVRRPQPRHWIPALRRIPSRIRNNPTSNDRFSSLTINTSAANRRAIRDIIERRPASTVKPRVDESQRPFANTETGVVEQGENTCYDRSRRGGPP